MKLIKIIIIITLLSLISSLFGDVVFNFTFKNDLENAKTKSDLIEFIEMQFNEAGKILGSYLNYDESVDICVLLFFSRDDNIAGGALTPLHNMTPEETKPGFYNTIVADKIQYGIDRNDKIPDAYILFNLKVLLGLEDKENLEEQIAEIKKIIIHELVHTLGFHGTLHSTPNWVTYEGKGVFSAFDYFIHDKNGIPLWTYKRYNDSAVNEPGYFVGPKAKEAFFNLPIPLPFLQGPKVPDYYHSSGQDAVSFVLIGNMMNNINTVASEDEPLCLSPIEVAMLQDIGFNINTKLATCKSKLCADVCINSNVIEDLSSVQSIASTIINVLPEEVGLSLRTLLSEDEEENSFSFLGNNTHGSRNNFHAKTLSP